MKKILICVLGLTSINSFALAGDISSLKTSLTTDDNEYVNNKIKLDKSSYGNEASGFVFHDKSIKVPTANDKVIYFCKGHDEPLVIYGLLKDAKNKDTVFDPIYVKNGFVASDLKVFNKQNWTFTASGPQVVTTNPDSEQLTFILQKKNKSSFYVSTIVYPTAIEAADKTKMIEAEDSFNAHNPSNYSYDENLAQPAYLPSYAASITRIVAENTTNDGIVVHQALYNSYSKGIDFSDPSKLDKLTYDFLPYKVNNTLNPLAYNYKGAGIIVCGSENENKNNQLTKNQGNIYINKK